MTRERRAAADVESADKSAVKICERYPLTPNGDVIVMSNEYTPPMMAAIRKAEPLTLEKAKQLAQLDDFTKAGKSHRSIISKAQSMGLEYIKLTPTRKPRENTPTKAAYLDSIRKALALPEREGDLTKAELAAILANIA